MDFQVKIINEKISLSELAAIAQGGFGEMIKVVIDVEKEVMAIGGELHADEEAVLVEHGSNPLNLWGANIYSAKPRNEWLEYTSLINIRPAKGNRDMEIQSVEIKEKIKDIINKLIQ